LIKDDHLLTNNRYFSSDVENAVSRIRDNFRHEHGIEKNAYSVFLAPGNEVAEV